MKTGIQFLCAFLDSRFRGNDVFSIKSLNLGYNSLKSLDITAEFIKEISQKDKSIVNNLKDEAIKNPAMGAYISVPDHLEKIREYIQSISSNLKDKISKDVLFSDKSISELNFLLEKIMELLNNADDLIIVKNTVILRYVKESEASITKTANDYATKHEGQLIGGVVTPMSSTLFLNILNALKGITLRARGIAKEVFG